MNNYAIKLGRIQVEFEALYAPNKYSAKELRSELLRICAREDMPIKCYDILENYLIPKLAKGA